MHHIIKKDSDICPYCKIELKGGWYSEFHIETHYKNLICECGKKNWIRVNFIGSGHDSFRLGNKKTIEDRLESEKRKEKKKVKKK